MSNKTPGVVHCTSIENRHVYHLYVFTSFKVFYVVMAFISSQFLRDIPSWETITPLLRASSVEQHQHS